DLVFQALMNKHLATYEKASRSEFCSARCSHGTTLRSRAHVSARIGLNCPRNIGVARGIGPMDRQGGLERTTPHAADTLAGHGSCADESRDRPGPGDCP